MKTTVFILLTVLLSGCAGYVIKDSKGNVVSSGECHGFFRTITVCEKYDKKGRITERRISTDSNTKDVLMGLNEFLDTTVNTAAKLKP